MTNETVRRAREILELFAEAQGIARDVTDEKHGNMYAHHLARKSADNAEQHKRRQLDPAKRAARAARKRALRAEKKGGPLRAYTRKAAA